MASINFASYSTHFGRLKLSTLKAAIRWLKAHSNYYGYLANQIPSSASRPEVISWRCWQQLVVNDCSMLGKTSIKPAMLPVLLICSDRST